MYREPLTAGLRTRIGQWASELVRLVSIQKCKHRPNVIILAEPVKARSSLNRKLCLIGPRHERLPFVFTKATKNLFNKFLAVGVHGVRNDQV